MTKIKYGVIFNSNDACKSALLTIPFTIAEVILLDKMFIITCVIIFFRQYALILSYTLLYIKPF